jgi:predicted DNA-binding transcriptional regulator AlpA
VTALRSFTTTQVAETTGIPRKTFEDLRIKGGGPRFLRLGRRKGVRYLETDVLDWMNSRRYGTLAEAAAAHAQTA